MKVKKFFLSVISGMLILTAMVCAGVRIVQTNIKPAFEMLAAEMAFPTGNAEYSEKEPELSEPPVEESKAVTVESSEISSPEESKTEIKEVKKEEFEISEPDESEIEE